MKILIITGKTEPHSGLGRYSLEVIRELRRQGEQVTVASGSGECDIRLESVAGLIGVFKNTARLRAAARQVEIVHALDAWPFAVYGWLAVLGRKQALYISGIGTYSLPPAKRSVKRYLLLCAYRRARHIFSISRYTQQRIIERLPFAISASVVHMGLSVLPKTNAASLERVRSKYDIPHGTQVVLTVGEIKDRKGQLDTARAVIRLRASLPNIVYLMVASGGDRTYIAQILSEARSGGAEGCCRLITDARTDQDIADLYAMTDVLILASNNEGDHFEGFGLVFLEAAQFGVPSIGTKDCGIEDAIADGVTGVLVPQHDPDAIAGALQRVLQHKEQFGAAARDFSKKFSWKTMVETYLQYYDENL